MEAAKAYSAWLCMRKWLATFCEFGGEIGETYGVPVEAIVAGIRNGVRKVNIDTDLRLAMSAAIRRLAVKSPGEFDPRKFFKVAKEAAEAICVARFEAFGAAGQAPRIKPLPFAKIAQRYG